MDQALTDGGQEGTCPVTRLLQSLPVKGSRAPCSEAASPGHWAEPSPGLARPIPTYLLQAVAVRDLVEPALQQRLQLAHALEAQLEGFEAADCRLAKHLPIQSPLTSPASTPAPCYTICTSSPLGVRIRPLSAARS